MIFGNKDIPIVVAIVSDNKIEEEFLKNYFNEKIEIELDEDDNKWVAGIFKSNISRETLNKLLLDLIKQNESFELSIDSEDDYVWETYFYDKGNDYITKSYVEYREDCKNGKEHLVDILFNEKQEEIKIKDLVGER